MPTENIILIIVLSIATLFPFFLIITHTYRKYKANKVKNRRSKFRIIKGKKFG